MDPGIIQLKRSGLCKTKRFTPPENNSVYRKCRLDANEYVSTCSGSSKDWKISSLCESEPTSFVYEGSSLANLQNSIGSVGTKFHFWDSNVGHSVEYQTFIANRKFRNSYCASCNSVAWQGCHIRETFKADINSSRLFDQYINGEKKYMFIFRIDFNERTCTRDSDAYLVYPNYETGQDTCQNMTALLRQCDCNEVMDLNTLACVTYKNGTTEESCNEVLPNTTIFNLPAYATNQCEENFTYKALPPADAQRECDRCSQQPRGSSNATECLEVYSFDLFETNAFSIFPTIHCYSRELLHCNLIFPDQKVGCVNDFMGRVTAHGVYHTTVETDVTILNALVIIYSPSTYVFTVLPTTVHGGFDLVFSTYIVETSSYCSTFDIDEAISSRFTVCPDKSIQSVSPPQLKHTDYYLEGEVVKVCAEYELPGFDLQLQDYILSALSITVSIIYIIYYLVRRRWTLTGNLIVSAIATLVGALLFYSLIKEVRNSKVACLYPVFSPYLCFVEGGWIRVLTFTGFIYSLILVNSILCVIAVYKIVKSDQNLHAADKKRTKKKILTVVKLQIIFGFHWILLFFTEIGGSGPAKRQLWTVLSVFITLQGISVVLSQVIQLESFPKLSRMFSRMKESKGDTSHNTDTAEIHGKTQSSQL
ncbi:hypothetical protein EB796_014993 [Bugula neritina]|uniref:Uncharacterized protein n=1 Tax=Bugula neritina TaxID=10212 RepID=A0A7J7JM34_BUGNE|nr:hypothetical protein EB796_014993 [Bugula neritina]